MTVTDRVLVTGFPESVVAVRLVRDLLRNGAESLSLVLSEDKLSYARSLLDRDWERIDVIDGTVSAMDLGLSGEEFRELAKSVRRIHHCPPGANLDIDAKEAERLNVYTTREVLELAEAADHLERLIHWSTALVSGDRRGFVLEGDLLPSEFDSPALETAFRAERMVKAAMDSVPTTVLRPAMIVGDSKTGAIEHLGGLHLMVQVFLNAPSDLRLPTLGKGDLPLNLVPIDYVITAGLALVEDPRSLGRTFHLADPDPLTARRVFDLLAKATGRPPPRGFLPTNIASAVLRAPGLDRFAQVPRAFVSQLGVEVAYDDQNTRELLSGKDIQCPPFESYVEALVGFVRSPEMVRAADHIAAV